MNHTTCACTESLHHCRLVVLTGGPGAGKTAVLEIVKRNFCEHVTVLPEAAGILYGGGFPRTSAGPTRNAAQRAIYHVQRELERAVIEEQKSAVALCDRGVLDGLAYWPESEDSYFAELKTSRETELSRYAAIIHLRTPLNGYNRDNPLRTESALEAARVDERIVKAWANHPRRFVVANAEDFLVKAKFAIDLIRNELPDCCRTHRVRELET